jgi:uncharacterized DUF497 family protein
LALEFEWDPRKAAANLAKHRVSFEEAATVFGDPLGRIVADPPCLGLRAKAFASWRAAWHTA